MKLESCPSHRTFDVSLQFLQNGTLDAKGVSDAQEDSALWLAIEGSVLLTQSGLNRLLAQAKLQSSRSIGSLRRRNQLGI